MSNPLDLPAGLTAEDIKALAASHGARNPRVFGSRARGMAQPDSDLDLLVEFEPGRDLLDLVALKQDLEARIGGSVDVVTEAALSRHIRCYVLETARPL